MSSTTDDSQCSVQLNTGRAVGLAFSAKAALLSLLAVLYLYIRVVFKYWRNKRNPPGKPWRLLRSNLDAYMLNLLFAELVVSVGGLIDAKWAIEQRTSCGGACSAQGALAQIGITATAGFITAVSVHTGYRMYTGQPDRCSLVTWLGLSVAIWVFVILFAIVGWSIHPDFYQPTPLWCWIGSNYPWERLWGQYIIIWMCAFGNILVYGPLYLFYRGNLVSEADEHGHMRWKFYFRVPNGASTSDVSLDKDMRQEMDEISERRSEAWKMLLYPFAYTLQVLGFSIVRWMSFQDPSLDDIQKPELAGMAAASLFFRWLFRLGGLVNVLLILKTRPNLLLFGSRGVLAESDPRAIRDLELERMRPGGGGDGVFQDVPMDHLRPNNMSRPGSGRSRPQSIRSQFV